MLPSSLLPFAALWSTAAGVKLRKIELDILKSSRKSLILFVADGCKECDRAQTILDKTSAALSRTPVAWVNCNEEPVACDEAGVFTVPTLKFATGNGDLITYKEALNESSIVQYIHRQSGSAVMSLSKENHLSLAESSRVAVIASFGALASPEDRKAFQDVAERWRTHYSFGAVDGDGDGDSGASSIAVYSQERDDVLYYTGDFNTDNIEVFLQNATTPLIHEFDPLVYDQLTSDEKPLAQIFFERQDDRLDIIRPLLPLAKKYKDQMHFVTALSSDYHKQAEKMHLGKDIKSGFAIADARGRAYPMNSTALDHTLIAQHVEAFLAGALRPAIKSEPIPQQSDSLPFLRTLVGSNFDEVAYDESRDVLVEFDVQWCQYCIDLRQVLNALGSKYAELGLSKKITVATIDVEANDVPTRVDGYPSIKLYRAGTNEIISFQGDFHNMITIEQLDEFVFNHGGHGLRLTDPVDQDSRDEL